MGMDELLWAATWLYKATRRSIYMDYIQDEAISASVSEFSWDLKYAGAQILLSQFYMEGKVDLHNFKQQADSYVCSVLPDSPDHQLLKARLGRASGARRSGREVQCLDRPKAGGRAFCTRSTSSAYYVQTSLYCCSWVEAGLCVSSRMGRTARRI